MNFSHSLACSFLVAAVASADDFEDRFKSAAKQVYEFDQETRRAGLAEMVRLAESDESRLHALLAEIDLDTRVLSENFLRGLGCYFDPKATRRAREILEALTVEPPGRQQFRRVLAVETPDPDRRKLVEEFFALGKTSILTPNPWESPSIGRGFRSSPQVQTPRTNKNTQRFSRRADLLTRHRTIVRRTTCLAPTSCKHGPALDS
ncbi:MAG: hypothetical protein FD180_1523 [Planctomycetota bacterium]|nr:MAG: hypothetical protein FD180_1523 [Planctomycetota bacterium]